MPIGILYSRRFIINITSVSNVGAMIASTEKISFFAGENSVNAESIEPLRNKTDKYENRFDKFFDDYIRRNREQLDAFIRAFIDSVAALKKVLQSGDVNNFIEIADCFYTAQKGHLPVFAIWSGKVTDEGITYKGLSIVPAARFLENNFEKNLEEGDNSDIAEYIGVIGKYIDNAYERNFITKEEYHALNGMYAKYAESRISYRERITEEYWEKKKQKKKTEETGGYEYWEKRKKNEGKTGGFGWREILRAYRYGRIKTEVKTGFVHKPSSIVAKIAEETNTLVPLKNQETYRIDRIMMWDMINFYRYGT